MCLWAAGSNLWVDLLAGNVKFATENKLRQVSHEANLIFCLMSVYQTFILNVAGNRIPVECGISTTSRTGSVTSGSTLDAILTVPAFPGAYLEKYLIEYHSSCQRHGKINETILGTVLLFLLAIKLLVYWFDCQFNLNYLIYETKTRLIFFVFPTPAKLFSECYFKHIWWTFFSVVIVCTVNWWDVVKGLFKHDLEVS